MINNLACYTGLPSISQINEVVAELTVKEHEGRVSGSKVTLLLSFGYKDYILLVNR